MDNYFASKTKLKSLKSRIMIYTIIPAAIILTIAAIFVAATVYSVIDNYSFEQFSDNSELVCSRVERVISDCGQMAAENAQKDTVRKFLMSADDRDRIEDNAYFSLAMGELDSVISTSKLIERAWLCSSSAQGVAFANSSSGWTAQADFSVSKLPFYNSALSGDYCLSDPYTSPITGDTVITAVSAVRNLRDGSELGIFCLDLSMEQLSISLTGVSGVFEKDSYVYIRSGDGTLLFDSKDSSSLFKRFKSKNLESTITDGSCGKYTMNGMSLIGCERAITGSNWTVYVLHDNSNISGMIKNYVVMIILAFAGVALILSLTISIASQKIAEPIQDYTRLINTLHFDDTDNDPNILVPKGCRELEHFAFGFNALIQRNNKILSQLREMNIRSEKERILYQTAIQSSSDIVFEYDIATDVLITYGLAYDSSVSKAYGNSFTDFMKRVAEDKDYHAEDLSSAEKFFMGSGKDEPVISKVLDDGSISWVSFEGTPVCNDGQPVKIVGKMRCIDDIMSLREDIERDMFSGLYNKLATEKHITSRLEAAEGCYAMIIVDVDNFKSVNDKLGHEYGDFVIKDISEKLSRAAKENDIVGRVGGDEFMILTEDRDEHNTVRSLCEKLNAEVKHIYSNSKGVSVEVSASIGTAFAPAHGNSFAELYRCADIAMYISKESGKDRYTFYDGQTRPDYTGR